MALNFSRRRSAGGLRATLMTATFLSAVAADGALAQVIELSPGTIILSTDDAVVTHTTDITDDPAFYISGDNVSLTIDGAVIGSTQFLPPNEFARDVQGAIHIDGDDALITINANASILSEGTGVKLRLGSSLPVVAPPQPTNASVVNYGTIIAQFDDGIELSNGSYIENHGFIRGGAGYAPGSQTGGTYGDGVSVFFFDPLL